MIGTIVNTVCILAGSLIGSVLKKGIKEEYQTALFTAMGFAATALGINAIVQNMPHSKYPVLFIVSLSIGGLIGTIIDFDGKFKNMVDRFSKTDLSKGLSTAILLFCIGTLSILGPVESALNHNHTYLFTNATLDLVTSMALAATYGIGIAFAAVVLFCWQGAIYLSAKYIEPFLTADLMTEISIVGGILILSSGLSILGIKDSKSLNMLPALFVPVLWFIILELLK
ncbi:DUF554 domain-containing protein [Ureibacillus sp. FSL K6-8385]|uniref:DUF554 domain-containing protein n=1 Tax=Ureibacillus terrenus TaxID=118246 RepID=A0A540V0N8_9BACL|nr:DUF554 domain-containing protein [Ureibacillus terrenus]MED3661419.1 DUF554 domain-containing protein [Ureibacillus terrenus]MED3763263.1 DUF554 domain-containing protein [Ureibacillus terrenus]TQE90319.1 DUF554 domain-containing protein [Ureibacillus terrenus]